jgi:tetratricopeptide (TPR) repeat protein
MRPGFQFAWLLAGCLAAGAPALAAQKTGQKQSKQPSSAQQTPSTPPAQPNGNPFPEDEKSVPVMPSGNAPDFSSDIEGLVRAAAPPRDRDPVTSPEDVAPGGSQSTSGFSASQTGLDNLTTPPPEPRGKNPKGDGSQIDMPRETPKEDLNVGNYYLDNHNWRGALSRFESALVLAPDNPDVYWGLAECQLHLGQYAAARENYLKVMEYDPGSRHAKEAKKRLRDPEISNAKPVPAGK